MNNLVLRASQTERWVYCPSSVRLMRQAESGVVPNFNAFYADEGTLAHELAALELQRMVIPDFDMEEYADKLREIQENVLYSREMIDHAETYLNEVRKILNECQANQVVPSFFIEELVQVKVNGVTVRGTADCKIEAGDTLYVVDYKYGMGIEVNAIGNFQLSMYALTHSQLTGKHFNKVVLVVVQPRIDNISTAVYDYSWLSSFSRVVVEAIENVTEENSVPTVGRWCKYCTAKPLCPAHKEKLEDLEHLGLLPSILTPEELQATLKDADYIAGWLKDVKDYAFSKAINGYYWPGFKLVETRRRRVITDTEAAAATLLESGYSGTDVFETKLLPITKLEKAMGKAEFNEILNPFIQLSEQKYDLVDSADKRPAASLNKPGDEF